jgi:hypothetical protein
VSALWLAASLWLHAGGDTVLVLRSNDTDRALLEERIAAELSASGFHVLSLTSGSEDSNDVPGRLWARCKQEGARAALWIALRGDGSIDAWAAEPDAAKAVVRTFPAPQTFNERAVVALKVAELLHAMLLEAGVVEPDDPDLPSSNVRFRQRFKPFWTFGTGLSVIFTPGGLQPEPMLELQLGYEANRSFSIDLQAAFTMAPEQSGTEESGLAYLRVMGQWTPVRSGPFALGLVGTVGSLIVWTSLDAAPRGNLAWLMAAGLSLQVAIMDRVRLQFLGTGGVAAPKLVDEASKPPTQQLQPVFETLLRLQFE